MTTRDTIYSIVVQEEDAEEHEDAEFPDGGFGWWVTFGSFLAHFFIGGGIAYSFSIFITEFSIEYKPAAAWVGSVLLGMIYAIGPIAGALVHQFGCRIVYIAGTVICAIGFGVSYLAPTNNTLLGIIFLFFTVGIVGGIGIGLTYLPAVVIMSYWFKKKRSLATGLASCGAGLGSFSLAPLLKYCVKLLEWRAALAITGGITLLCGSFGFFFRAVPKSYTKSKAITLPTSSINVPASTQKSGPQENVSAKPSSNREEGFEDIPLESEAEADSEPEDLTTSGHKKVAIDEAYNQISTLDDRKATRESKSCCRSCLSSGFCHALRSTFHAELWTDLVLMYLCLVHFMASFSASVPLVLIDSLLMGLREDMKTTMSSTMSSTTSKHDENKDFEDGLIVGSIGLFSSVGGCVLGYISDKQCVNRLHILSASVAISGVVIALFAHANSIAIFVSCTAVFGLSNGAYAFLTPVVFVDVLGIEKLSHGFGIVLLFQGIGTVIAPPIAEVLGSPPGVYMAGAVAVLSGILFCFLPCIKKCHDKRREKAKRTVPRSKVQSWSELNE